MEGNEVLNGEILVTAVVEELAEALNGTDWLKIMDNEGATTSEIDGMWEMDDPIVMERDGTNDIDGFCCDVMEVKDIGTLLDDAGDGPDVVDATLWPELVEIYGNDNNSDWLCWISDNERGCCEIENNADTAGKLSNNDKGTFESPDLETNNIDDDSLAGEETDCNRDDGSSLDVEPNPENRDEESITDTAC